VSTFGVERRDYAFPVRIDGGSQQAAQAQYADHVAQMIEQVLLTSPGERVDLPQFGCQLEVFAPMSSSLEATLTLQITQALNQWLGNLISVAGVSVTTSDDDALLEPGTVQVTVTYTLIDTQSTEQTTVTLS
jgi:uncharacterized protein